MTVYCWTRDQEEMWQELRGDRPSTPSGQQTPEQALNLAVASWRYACHLVVDPPPVEAVERRFRAEFRLGPGVR